MDQTSSERRSFPRAKRILSIEYRLTKPQRRGMDNDWHLSTTQDMSLSGISFYSEHEYRINNILEIRVVMSGILDIFKGLVKVVRSERKRTGSVYFIAVKFLPKKTRTAKAYTRPSLLKKTAV